MSVEEFCSEIDSLAFKELQCACSKDEKQRADDVGLATEGCSDGSGEGMVGGRQTKLLSISG